MFDFKKFIKIVPGFPTPEIKFKDITPLIGNGKAFSELTKEIVSQIKELKPDLIVSPEARGFILGCPVAVQMNIGFVPVRKPGKLPRDHYKQNYELEYGNNELSMHKDAIKPGQRVIIIDDILATGGTVRACADLIKKCGGKLVSCVFLGEIKALNGRKNIEEPDSKVISLLDF